MAALFDYETVQTMSFYEAGKEVESVARMTGVSPRIPLVFHIELSANKGH